MSNRKKIGLASRPHVAQTGSCITCLTGTDTGLAVNGDYEWMAAFLVTVGVPTNEAIATIEEFGPALDGSGRATATFRLCRSCAATHAPQFPAPVLIVIGGEGPCVRQP